MDRIDANLYLNLIRGGAARLGLHRQEINDLNVFPIPDGDTGDNMYMTIQAGCTAAGRTLPEVAKAVSAGMLMGARGNSGVILSRMFAGIAKGLADVREADVKAFSRAMQVGVEESYHAVSEPVEGTILTVFREGVAAAAGSKDLDEYFDLLTSAMDLSLQHTPELLDVLKKAGVVDSGGAGLLYIAEGMRAALHGEAAEVLEEAAPAAQHVDLDAFTEDSVLEFGYCTEFLLRLQRSKVDLDTFDETVIADWLAAHGESLVFFRDGSIIKVHVHTHTPGEILNHCQQYGEFLTIKVENMTLQHHENHMDERFKKGRKAFGVVAVASGAGLVDTFKELGADIVIEGGQTMNPPVKRFIDAFDAVDAETVFVFPNNGNILLTARQAADIYDKADIRVIPKATTPSRTWTRKRAMPTPSRPRSQKLPARWRQAWFPAPSATAETSARANMWASPARKSSHRARRRRKPSLPWPKPWTPAPETSSSSLPAQAAPGRKRSGKRWKSNIPAPKSSSSPAASRSTNISLSCFNAT